MFNNPVVALGYLPKNITIDLERDINLIRKIKYIYKSKNKDTFSFITLLNEFYLTI